MAIQTPTTSASTIAGTSAIQTRRVWYAIAIPDHETEAVTARLPFDRERIRQFSTISVLNLLRMRLLALP